MDDGIGMVVGVFLIVAISTLVGLISYENGRDSAREQAVAAKVGRYVAEPDAGLHFEWGCEAK